jgi:hypothetical protein
MNIALPILLLILGGLTLWVLNESTVRWYIKTACISTFCIFTILFWGTIHSFLGWPANQEDMPNKVLVHWVIIKEPNKAKEDAGAIYVLLETAEKIKANKLFKFFGYDSSKIQPRLFELEYSRKLHEKMEGIKSKLQQGQPVLGEFQKVEGAKKGKAKGEKGESDEDGDGSESQEQGWEFHELRPSDFQDKPSD